MSRRADSGMWGPGADLLDAQAKAWCVRRVPACRSLWAPLSDVRGPGVARWCPLRLAPPLRRPGELRGAGSCVIPRPVSAACGLGCACRAHRQLELVAWSTPVPPRPRARLVGAARCDDQARRVLGVAEARRHGLRALVDSSERSPYAVSLATKIDGWIARGSHPALDVLFSVLWWAQWPVIELFPSDVRSIVETKTV